jgi:hypothetical protein
MKPSGFSCLGGRLVFEVAGLQRDAKADPKEQGEVPGAP